MKDMLGRGGAVSYDDALRLIMDAAPGPVGTELVPLERACGRVLGTDITSPEDIPGFTRTTVDGFAVRASDTFGASDTSPAYLTVTREILMGQRPDFTLARGEAARIATGGMLPDGADAALMLEHAEDIDGAMIEAHRAVAPGENVIQRGEDLAQGTQVLQSGRRLSPGDVSVLASLGVAEVEVYRRPRVAVISTGNEIIPLGEPLEPGRIRDSNSYMLAALLAGAGAEAVRIGIVRDELNLLKSAVEECLAGHDMVLITGGSSVGTRDYAEAVLAGLGRVLFHGVAMRPGKPLLAAVCGKGVPVLGLPGHPRAVAVSFDNFARPILWRLSGMKGEFNRGPGIKCRIARTVSSVPGRRDVLQVRLEERDGVLWADPVHGKSGLMMTMSASDGVIVLREDCLGYETGDEVAVYLPPRHLM